MSLRVELADPLSEGPPDGWDRFVTDAGWGGLWHFDVLRSLAGAAQAPTLLALVADASGHPWAAFHARHLGLPGSPLTFAAPGRWPWTGLVECRHQPSASLPGHVFAAGLDERGRAEASAAFAAALRRRLRARYTALVHRTLSASDLRSISGPLTLKVKPHLAIEIAWPDFDGYLASLPGDRRREMRRSRRAIDEDVTVNWEPGVDPRDAARLAETVRRRHRSRRHIAPPVPERYFVLLGQAPEVHFLTYRDHRAALLGFVAVHDTGTRLISLLWGAPDHTEGGRPGLYFDLYPRLVERAIQLGRTTLDLGKGLPEVKTRYGATPHDRHIVMVAR